MFLYHGTDNLSAENIINVGIDFEKCDLFSDNARGFYLSIDREFAKVRAGTMTFKPKKPVVIEMYFDEKSAEKELNILRFDDVTDEWRFFVAFNRVGIEGYELMNAYFPNMKNNLGRCYDLVVDIPADAGISGITDRIDELLVSAGKGEISTDISRTEILQNIKLINLGNVNSWSKQYSFHTMRSLKFLEPVRIIEVV